MSSTNTEQQIQQAINDVQSEAKLNKPGFPLEVTLETGERYTGATPQELLDKLVAGKTEASKAIKAERDRNAELTAQVAMLQQQIPVRTPSQDEKQAKIQEYYNVWAKDPTEATKQNLAELLGVPAENVVEVMKDAIGSSFVNRAADEFTMRCPDFPQTPQNAVLMRDALAAKYGKTIQAATADNLEIVYHQLVRDGRIQPNALPVQGVVNGNVPLPNIRGGSAPPDAELDIRRRAYTMPINELKAVIDRLSTQGR